MQYYIKGDVISYVGSPYSPWYIQVAIKQSAQSTQLVGIFQAPVINGYANFSGITFSNVSTSVVLEFTFVTPSGSNPYV